MPAWFTLPLFCLTLCLSGRAQEQRFVPVTEDVALLTTLSNNYLQQYQQGIGKLPPHNKKAYQEVYAERWKSIKERFDKQEIYTSVSAQAYLDALTEVIVKNNPGLKAHPFHCYFSRSSIPNASYIGEGIILFNMGLFSRLANESEAAFILCHEIAHCILQHNENSIAKYVETINSEEVQSQLRKIKGSEYRKNEQLNQLVKGLAFDSRRHSRDHEAQADSMGVELMRHTPYDLGASLSTLVLLDGIDQNDFNIEASLQEKFNSNEYPFKKKWLHKEEGLLGGHASLKDEVMADSLKTHPSCPQRIKLLTPMVQSGHSAMARAFVVDSAGFVSLQGLFRFETIEYAFASDEYTESLFLCLQLLQQRPADAYLLAQVGRILNGLYTAEKGHTLSKVADLPAPGYPKSYNLLLQWVQNLYLDDLASISYYFLHPWHPRLDQYDVFKKAYEQSQRQLQQ